MVPQCPPKDASPRSAWQRPAAPPLPAAVLAGLLMSLGPGFAFGEDAATWINQGADYLHSGVVCCAPGRGQRASTGLSPQRHAVVGKESLLGLGPRFPELKVEGEGWVRGLLAGTHDSTRSRCRSRSAVAHDGS